MGSASGGRLLYEANLIRIIRDTKGTEFFFLKNDIRVEKFYPDYLIDVILKLHNNKLSSKPVLIQHLKLLEETFLEIGENIKLAKKEKKSKEKNQKKKK